MIRLAGKDITPENHYMILACADSQRSSPDEEIFIEGYLRLKDCEYNIFLPDNLTIGVGLWLNGCLGLVHLPKNLKTYGPCDLGRCCNLVTIPETLWVGERLLIDGCSSLPITLPDNLHFKDILVDHNKRDEFIKFNPQYVSKMTK